MQGWQVGLGMGGVSATWTYLCVERQAQRAVPQQGSELLLLKIPPASALLLKIPLAPALLLKIPLASALASEPRGSSSAGQRKRHVGESGKKKLKEALGSYPGKPSSFLT